MNVNLTVRYICETKGDEVIVEAANAPEAAEKSARIFAEEHGRGTFMITVSEANEYDLPLIVGDDYEITVE